MLGNLVVEKRKKNYVKRPRDILGFHDVSLIEALLAPARDYTENKNQSLH